MAATALGAARPMLVAVALDKAAGLRVREWVKVWDSWRIYRDMICTITNFPGEKISFLYSFVDGQETSKRVALLGIIASGFRTGRRFGASNGQRVDLSSSIALFCWSIEEAGCGSG